MTADTVEQDVVIDPFVIELDFFSDEVSAAIAKIVGLPVTHQDRGFTVRALVLDTMICEHTQVPSLEVLLLVGNERGHYQTLLAKHFFHIPKVAAAIGAIMGEATCFIGSIEYLVQQLPLNHVGRYLRSYHMPGSTLVTMEHLEGWIYKLGDDLFEEPDSIDHRCQIATFALPDRPTAHGQIEAIAQAQKDWASIRDAWTSFLGFETPERLKVGDPDLSSYPNPI